MPGVGLPDLLEGEVVADGEHHHRHHSHPQEVHDDVRVQVVAVLTQVRHLQKEFDLVQYTEWYNITPPFC